MALKTQESRKAVKATCFWSPVSPSKQGSFSHQSVLNDKSQLPPRELRDILCLIAAQFWCGLCLQTRRRKSHKPQPNYLFSSPFCKIKRRKVCLLRLPRSWQFYNSAYSGCATRLAQETKVYTVPGQGSTLGAAPSPPAQRKTQGLCAPTVRVIKGCPLLFSVTILWHSSPQAHMKGSSCISNQRVFFFFF